MNTLPPFEPEPDRAADVEPTRVPDVQAGRRIQEIEQELAHLRHTKETLQASYRETFAHAGVGIAHVDVSGRILDANASFCRMMGLSADELAQRTFQDLTHPDDLQTNLAELERLLRGEISGYRIEKRYVRASREVFWADLTVSAHRDAEGRPLKLISVINDITAKKQHEEHLAFLMAELSHRTKNLLAVIQAIVNQTDGNGSIPAFRSAIAGRLASIAASQDALLTEEGRKASIRDLIERQLAVFLEPDDERIKLDGGVIILGPDATRAIGMALHELATNAYKYGALSEPAGRVAIAWGADKDAGTFWMSWREQGGPPVVPPDRTGFGRRVIESMVAMSTDGEVVLAFEPDGVEWKLTAPMWR